VAKLTQKKREKKGSKNATNSEKKERNKFEAFRRITATKTGDEGTRQPARTDTKTKGNRGPSKENDISDIERDEGKGR